MPREAVHKRQINCNGFVREDGLYDIEAELTDHKTYAFPSDFRGTVTPDLPVHHMVLRITINKDRVIQHAEAITITGPYAICPTANAVFRIWWVCKLAPDGGAKYSRDRRTSRLYAYLRIVRPGGDHCLSNPVW